MLCHADWGQLTCGNLTSVSCIRQSDHLSYHPVLVTKLKDGLRTESGKLDPECFVRLPHFLLLHVCIIPCMDIFLGAAIHSSELGKTAFAEENNRRHGKTLSSAWQSSWMLVTICSFNSFNSSVQLLVEQFRLEIILGRDTMHFQQAAQILWAIWILPAICRYISRISNCQTADVNMMNTRVQSLVPKQMLFSQYISTSGTSSGSVSPRVEKIHCQRVTFLLL